MRYLKSLLLIAVLTGTPAGVRAAADTLAVSETRIPVLIDRQDNEMFHLRIDATQTKTLDEVTLRFGDEVNLGEIESVKLYYGGTEAPEHKGKTRFAPVDYVSGFRAGMTRRADPSYSVLRSEAKAPAREVTLRAGQKLFPGVNYFWVSLQMKPDASILSKVSAEVTGARADGKPALVHVARRADTHRLGVGVRQAGDDGVAAYRIPGLVTTNEGTLLGVYDVRHNNSADLQEYVEIGLSRSTDGGQTWEKMRIPMSFGETDGLPRAQNGVGDPAILVDRQTGAVWIVAAWTHGMGNGRAWWNSQPGMDRDRTAQLMMVRSDDDGLTWSEPVNVTEQVKDPAWYFLLQGPGRGISMDDGTLVFASQYIGEDRVPNAGIIYSKDHGKTWRISQLARTNTTESQVAEVEPGVLMLNMRDNRGGSRAVATTADMGQTWTEHPSSRSALREPVCMASLISVKAKDNVLGKDILLFSNPDDTKNRHSITIKASLDGGLTWNEADQLLLDAGWGWGYSCLTMIDRETVGILYESSVAHMTFQAVKLADIVRTK